MHKKIKIALCVAIFTIFAILIRGIGIPILAKPSFDLKGFGLAWSWQTNLKNGCVQWYAAPSHDYVLTSILSDQHDCSINDLNLENQVGLTLRHSSSSSTIVFYREGGPDLDGGEPCPFTLTDEEIATFQKLVLEAKETANAAIEMPALNKIKARLKDMDVQKLETDGPGGCRF